MTQESADHAAGMWDPWGSVQVMWDRKDSGNAVKVRLMQDSAEHAAGMWDPWGSVQVMWHRKDSGNAVKVSEALCLGRAE